MGNDIGCRCRPNAGSRSRRLGRTGLPCVVGTTQSTHARFFGRTHSGRTFSMGRSVSTRAREFLTFWDRYDVLVSPTAGMLPPSVDWAPWDQAPSEHRATFATMPNFAQPFNLSGQPAISLPLAWSAEGLPIGIQIVGRRLEETMLLELASQLETAIPWSAGFPRSPPLTRVGPRSSSGPSPPRNPGTGSTGRN